MISLPITLHLHAVYSGVHKKFVKTVLVDVPFVLLVHEL